MEMADVVGFSVITPVSAYLQKINAAVVLTVSENCCQYGR